MRSALILCALFALTMQWVIYRKNNPKRKIICKPESEWDASSESDESGASTRRVARDVRDVQDRFVLVRVRRDVEIDPKTKQPIIFLGGKHNVSSSFIDDGDFDVVSDYLSLDELKFVKNQIMSTCNYLDRQHQRKLLEKTAPTNNE